MLRESTPGERRQWPFFWEREVGAAEALTKRAEGETLTPARQAAVGARPLGTLHRYRGTAALSFNPSSTTESMTPIRPSSDRSAALIGAHGPHHLILPVFLHSKQTCSRGRSRDYRRGVSLLKVR